MSRSAPGHLVVDRNDVRVMTADFEHSFRRNAVVVRDESHMNEIHDIVISKNDRLPLLAMLLLVVTPGLAVRRPRSDSNGNVVDLGTDTVADRDVPPREPAHPHVHNGRRLHPRMLGNEEHNGQFLVADAPLADHNHLALGHVVVVRYRDVEVSDARIDAERRLGVCSPGDRECPKRDQRAHSLSHR